MALCGSTAFIKARLPERGRTTLFKLLTNFHPACNRPVDRFTGVRRGKRRLPQWFTKTLLLMKLTFLLLTLVLLQAHASGVAQTITFSGKDVPLQKVFTAIEKQTG